MKKINNQRETAEALALRALAWLAGNDDLLPVFLGASGASLADMAARAEEPEFLAAVIDFILMDDAWVLAAASDLGAGADSFVAARAALPGGGGPHWT